jgi:hypothetical protein
VKGVSGAPPISVTERGTIRTGRKIIGTVTARWWINERDAAPESRSAAEKKPHLAITSIKIIKRYRSEKPRLRPICYCGDR